VLGSQFGRGERVSEARRWIGSGGVRARYGDVDRGRAPGALTWYDSRGRIVQRWIDADRNGRADRVDVYENDRIVA
jgi:hypothetical protein